MGESPSIFHLTEWISKLYHPDTKPTDRAEANERLTNFQNSRECWPFCVEILKSFQGNVDEIIAKIASHMENSGSMMEPSAAAEMLLYFAANSLASEARNGATFAECTDLCSLRNSIAFLLKSYSQNQWGVSGQLAVTAACLVVFQCAQATMPHFELGVPSSKEKLEAYAKEFGYSMRNVQAMIQPMVYMQKLLRGEPLNVPYSRAWCLSDAYMICNKGPQIGELLQIFQEDKTMLVVLFKEIAEELINPRQGGVSQDRLLRAIGWLLPHTSNILDLLCNLADSDPSMEARCLSALTSWLRLHNLVQDGVPQDYTWGSLERDARESRTGVPSHLQVHLHKYSIIKKLPKYLGQIPTFKDGLAVIGEIVQLTGCFTTSNGATLLICYEALASVCGQVREVVVSQNSHTGVSTAGIIMALADMQIPFISSVPVDWSQITLQSEVTDCGIYQRLSADQLEEINYNDNDLIMSWISTVYEIFNWAAIDQFRRWDTFELNISFLHILETLRTLIVSCLHYGIRDRAMDCFTRLTSSFIRSTMESYSEFEVTPMLETSRCKSEVDMNITEEEVRCRMGDLGEMGESICIIDGRYIGIDPKLLFHIIFRNLLLCRLHPSILAMVEDVSFSEKVTDFNKNLTNLNIKMQQLVDVSGWVQVQCSIILRIVDKNKALENWSIYHALMTRTAEIMPQDVPGCVRLMTEKLLTEFFPQNGQVEGFPPLHGDTVIVSAMLRSSFHLLISNCVDVYLSLTGVQTDNMMIMIQHMMFMIITTNKITAMINKSTGRQNSIGCESMLSLEFLTESIKNSVVGFRNFMREYSLANRCSTDMVTNTIERYGFVLLDSNIDVVWRGLLCSGFGDLIATSTMSDHIDLLWKMSQVILTEIEKQRQAIWAHSGSTPQNDSPLIPPKYITVSKELEKLGGHEPRNEDQMLMKTFQDLLSLLRDVITCTHTAAIMMPRGMALWPRTEENMNFQSPSLAVLEMLFDQVSDLYLITLGGSTAVLTSCTSCFMMSTKQSPLHSLHYPVSQRFLTKIGESFQLYPTIFHYDVVRSYLNMWASYVFMDSNVLRILAAVTLEMVEKTVDNIEKVPNYVASNPQMAGMTIDTLGTAALVGGIISQATLNSVTLVKALNMCIKIVDNIKDHKFLMTVLLLFQRYVMWVAEGNINRPEHHSPDVIVRAVTLNREQNFVTRIIAACTVTCFTYFDGNEQWLGLYSQLISENMHDNIVNEMKQGFREGLVKALGPNEQRILEYEAKIWNQQGGYESFHQTVKDLVAETRSLHKLNRDKLV